MSGAICIKFHLVFAYQQGMRNLARDSAKFLLACNRVENSTYMDWKLEKPLTWRKQVGLGYWAYSALYLRLVTR
jgi:hypothetical protein